jgi:hypothetical protein
MLLADKAVVPVWTTRTKFINADLDPANVAYDRIIAVGTKAGSVVECADIATRSIRPFWLIKRRLQLPSVEMAERFIDYFGGVIARNNIRLKGYNPVEDRDRPETDYNCHEFADVLIDGVTPSGWRNACKRADGLLPNCTDVRGTTMTAGLRGMIASESIQSEHSFVSLGGKRCLNVTAIGGTVGITTIGDILKDYGSERGLPVRAVYLDPSRAQSQPASGQSAVTVSLPAQS